MLAGREAVQGSCATVWNRKKKVDAGQAAGLGAHKGMLG